MSTFTVTVADLRSALKGLRGDARVVIVCSNGEVLPVGRAEREDRPGMQCSRCMHTPPDAKVLAIYPEG